MRVAMYWHNGRSLGHTAESAKIAKVIARDLPDATLAGLTGAYRGLDLLPQNLDVIRLPSFTNYDRHTGWGLSNKLGLETKALFQLREELSDVFLKHYEPHILIVNHLPRGAEGELEAPLRMKRARKNVLTLRGVLNDPEKTNREYFSGENAEWIAEHYDLIVVHAPTKLFRLEDYYDVPDFLLERMKYTGYLAQPTSLSRSAARSALGWDEDERWAVASMGGGQGVLPIWEQLVSALVEQRQSLDRALLVTGPYIEADDRKVLLGLTEPHPWIDVQEYRPDVPVMMSAADVFIGAAGSNMVGEVLAASSNAILIPRQIREQEQRIHGNLISRSGLARVCALSDVHEGKLSSALPEALAHPQRPEVPELLSGADQYPALLKNLLEEQAGH